MEVDKRRGSGQWGSNTANRGGCPLFQVRRPLLPNKRSIVSSLLLSSPPSITSSSLHRLIPSTSNQDLCSSLAPSITSAHQSTEGPLQAHPTSSSRSPSSRDARLLLSTPPARSIVSTRTLETSASTALLLSCPSLHVSLVPRSPTLCPCGLTPFSFRHPSLFLLLGLLNRSAFPRDRPHLRPSSCRFLVPRSCCPCRPSSSSLSSSASSSCPAPPSSPPKAPSLI